VELEVGSVLDGKVTGITKFGAFVSLPVGRTGMVHISEVSYSYVSDIKEYLAEGQEVKVRVLAVDKEGRINLSIKKAASPRAQMPSGNRPLAAARPASRGVALSFEDKLKQFMQDSQTKMSDLNTDRRGSRRGGRR
jgi:S1 RNA binding domain protein